NSWELRDPGRNGMGQYGRRNIRQFSTLTTTKGCTGTLPEHPPIRINPKDSLKFEEPTGPSRKFTVIWAVPARTYMGRCWNHGLPADAPRPKHGSSSSG